jgi:hypothetical protein
MDQRYTTAYTSLLRITTSPPPSKDGKDNRDSTSSDGLEAATPATVASTTTTASRGLAALRPAFLRGVSRGATTNAPAEQAEPVPTLPRDVERAPETTL